MSSTKTIDDKIGLKAHIVDHPGYVCCPYVPEKFVALEPAAAPSNPEIGDVWAEEAGDEIFFYIWNGDHWVEALGGGIRDEDEPVEEIDTPERAYERAMGVLK